MVTTAQGLELFQQGVGGLAQGIATGAQQKRLSGAAESIRAQPAESFKGGEMGRTLAASSVREGDIGGAAKFFPDEQKQPSIQDYLGIAARLQMEGKSEEAAHILNSVNSIVGPYKRATKTAAERVDPNAVNPDGTLNPENNAGIEHLEVPFDLIVANIDALPPPMNATDDEKAAWRIKTTSKLQKSLSKNYGNNFGPEAYEFMTDMIEARVQNQGVQDIVGKDGKIIHGSGIQEFKKSIDELPADIRKLAVPYSTKFAELKSGKGGKVVALKEVPSVSQNKPTYKTADDVAKAVAAGKLSADEGHKILVSQFGMTE